MMKPAKVDVHVPMPAILFVNPSIAPQVSLEEDFWQVILYVWKDLLQNIKTNAVFLWYALPLRNLKMMKDRN